MITYIATHPVFSNMSTNERRKRHLHYKKKAGKALCGAKIVKQATLEQYRKWPKCSVCIVLV